ncbi:MAG: bifunctional phosphopantothenoylcysteine decarboxylase/phosphopantothenate--cysteine ligase CoaBC [Succinivibrio sp.]|nr:bifunctional phosphopantothenoylcysteine decarboxylase/phosphopantothenate--cysteine ligase CoaBC [Succinivibrio sp.]
MDTQLKNRKIILGVTGGIAAYKSCTLCRLLIKAGADVYVCMTPAATKLVGKDTFEALTGHKVAIDIFDEAKDISHVGLAKDADLFLVAPATANTIANIAGGFADNMLTATLLASTCPVVVAPAMNTNMYNNIATQTNLSTLVNRGIYVLTPNEGELACGIVGTGRMKEPEEIFSDVCSILSNRIAYINHHPQLGLEQEKLPAPQKPLELTQTRLLPKSLGVGLKVIITAGPTEEQIDPVRYISNNSSGKMGYALAQVAAYLGADVTLISGPTNLQTPFGVKRIDVKSAVQMLHAVESYVTQADIMIGCAAVADYRVENPSPIKIKKKDDENSITLKLIKNPDIVATVGHRQSHRPFTVGFAAETNNFEQNAKDKLVKKNLDLIILNDVSNKSIGFNSDENEVKIFDRDGQLAHFDKQSKQVIAQLIMELIFKTVRNK